MIFHQCSIRAFGCVIALSILFGEVNILGQGTTDTVALDAKVPRSISGNNEPIAEAAVTPVLSPTVALYFDPLQGSSSVDLVRRALTSNGELAAARLDVERARARIRQAALRPNPAIDVEYATGRFVGSAGEHETIVGLSVPIELGGKRRRRIELAQAELEAEEAEIADRERRLTSEIRSSYAEALAALRELQITENLNGIDVQTTKFVQARVNEGESAPIELNLLRVEVDRLRSRRALVEARLQAALLKLKYLASFSATEQLRLREDLETVALPSAPGSIDAATEIALRTRPDLRLARLTEEVAEAGLRLAHAEGTPNIIPFTKYSNGRSVFDDAPTGPFADQGSSVSFGLSIDIPVFNRNQGSKAEAAIRISQSRKRREFLEQVVRSEVASAYLRYEAARGAVQTYNQGVVVRSNENIAAIRAAYQIGEFRITDLLAEQRRLLDSQGELTEALTEQYRALADLAAAMGLPIN
jgi:cobalt-zinc-cadmium efflux system outer membrane protein